MDRIAGASHFRHQQRGATANAHPCQIPAGRSASESEKEGAARRFPTARLFRKHRKRL